MSKIIDITDKLNFEEKPKIKIGDLEVEVNNDAASILKVGALFDDGKMSAGALMQIYELLFSESGREKIDALKLSFEDFNTLLISTATAVIGADGEGEEETPATT